MTSTTISMISFDLKICRSRYGMSLFVIFSPTLCFLLKCFLENHLKLFLVKAKKGSSFTYELNSDLKDKEMFID